MGGGGTSKGTSPCLQPRSREAGHPHQRGIILVAQRKVWVGGLDIGHAILVGVTAWSHLLNLGRVPWAVREGGQDRLA